MKHTMKWAMRIAGVVTLVAVTVAAIALYPGTSFAQTAEETTTTITRTLGLGWRGMHGESGMMGVFGFGARSQDDSPLADALGITVDELNAAREKVFTDELAQAVADGTITQEEADALLAQRALHSFLSERLQNAYTEAIEAAVEEGIITQEQADEYLSQDVGRFGRLGAFDDMPGHGMMGRGMMGKGMMGRGMSGMMDPGTWFDNDETPGRGMRGRGQ